MHFVFVGFALYVLTRYLYVMSWTRLCISFKTPTDTALACVKNVPFVATNYGDFLPTIMLLMRCHQAFCSILM